MGQIATQGTDVYKALTQRPKPELSYLEHWLFDTTAQSATNDADGIVDAGETIDLAIVIRNHWGKADNVTVNLRAYAAGAVQDDPYVTFITSNVSYGAIGSFNWDDNGLIYDTQGVITGVRNPFRFTVSANCTNDHVIPFLLTMTGKNGLDPTDNTTYSFQSRFNLIVQRGRELPRIISGTPQMGAKTDFAAGSGPRSVAAADFNSDNRADLAVANANSNTVSVLFNSGNGTFAAKTDYAVGSNPISVAAADFNSDNRADLAVANYISNTVSVLLNYENGIFMAKGVHAVGVNHLSVAAADFNGDNRTDLAVANSGSNTVSVLMNTGNTVFWNMTLTKDYYWIVPGQTLIEASAAVRITEGTQVQWGTPKPQDPYSQSTTPYMQVEGTLLVQGTYEEPVEMFPSPLVGSHTYIQNMGTTHMRYATIRNPQLGAYGMYNKLTSLDHCYIDWDRNCWGIGSGSMTNCIVHKLKGGTCGNWGFGPGAVDTCLLDNSWLDSGWGVSAIRNSVFLPDNQNDHGIRWTFEGMTFAASEQEASANITLYRNNAFLSKYWDPNINHWMRFYVPGYCYSNPRGMYYGIANNYWGTTSTTLIDAAIQDFNDDFNLPHVVYQPILTTPAESTYPFVANVVISQGSENTTRIGPGLVTFTVTFNRDMNTSVPPQVSFGPDVPVTDYTVHPVSGGWQNPRTWKGTFNITPITGDGYQLMRIAGARAASDPWLVTGDDAGRFRFEIITSGTEAMNLQATGAEGRVDLMWTQDDFDLLAGYNLYRSTSASGRYTRLNSTVIPAYQKSYRDTNVQPGQTYYYKFTVVKTDMTESNFSNVAVATPIDTIPPVISHTPVTSAAVGLPLSIYADVTDNVRVVSVTLYYRAVGATTYQTRDMVKTTGNRYSATLEGSLVTAPGLEYYLQVTDGVSIVRSGRADLPYRITVTDVPQITGVSPNQGPTSSNITATISGSNFKSGASVTFGGALASNVTVASANQITCVTPPHLPGVVDVTVTNPDGGTGTLLRAFTYLSAEVLVSLPDVIAGRNAIIEIPVTAASVEGLLAAHLAVQFDRNVLTARSARTGTLTPGLSLAANTATPGQISVSLASATAVSGSGVLTYLEFLVTGVPSSSSNLTLTSVSLNDGAIPVALAHGTFRIEDLLNISGYVRYYNGSRAVSNVTLSLSGDGAMSQTTNELGYYTLTNIPRGNYSLSPSKSDNTAAITSYDASLILQASVGLISLSAQQRKAADADRSDNVTPMDAAYVLQKSAQLIDVPFPGAGKVWDFEPLSRSYQPLSTNATGQDFTAILIGDVSGNWGEPALAGQVRVKSGTVELLLPQVPALPSGQITVPLYLIPSSGAQLYSADIVVSFDPMVASAISVTKAALSDTFSIAVNLNRPGEARVAMAAATPITAGGELLNITFNIIGSVGKTSLLNIALASLNEGGLSTQPRNGSVVVVTNLVNIATVLEGGSRDELGWVIPVTVKFFTPGTDVLSGAPLYTFNLTTAKSGGKATGNAASVPPGTYDITVVSEHTLMNVKRNVVVTAPTTAVDMSTLLEGNANNDGLINISDFGILAVSFMKTAGTPGFDARADFDRNGIINISDFGLLAVNFLQASPVIVAP